MAKVHLREIAHSRAGDKGNICNISVIPYNEDHYHLLRRQLTAGLVKEFFGGLVREKVERFEVPGIKALNFVLHGVLAGGVTRSLNIDAHGKTLSSLVLNIEIDCPEDPGRTG